MIKLKKIEMDQKKIINDLIPNIRDVNLKKRIVSSENEIIEKSKKYDKTAEKSELYKFEEHDKLESGAQKNDMIKLYNEKFSRLDQLGRKYYDKIILSAPYKRCPYCGHREVSTLDHYLAKTKFPVFSITPYNLIPCCSECNRQKTSTVIKQKEKQIIHPYYDDFSKETWIFARLIEGDPIVFEFYVQCPKEWDEIKKERAKNHFEEFKLNELYSPYAAEESIECLGRIKRLFKKGGQELAMDELQEDIRTIKEHAMNSWKVAMYQAIRDSSWFWEIYLPNEIKNREC